MKLEGVIDSAKEFLILKFIAPIFNSPHSPIEIIKRKQDTLLAATQDELIFKKELLGDNYPLSLDFSRVQMLLRYFLENPNSNIDQMDNQDAIGEMVFAKALSEVLMIIDKLNAYYVERPVSRVFPLENEDSRKAISRLMKPIVHEIQKIEFQKLKVYFRKVLFENDELIQREINKYTPLFDLGNHEKDWYDLSGEPYQMAQKELKELYLVCQTIKDGQFESVVASTFIGRVGLFGKALAIQDYIPFLETEQILLKGKIKVFVLKEAKAFSDPAEARVRKAWVTLKNGGFIECNENDFQSLFNNDLPKMKVRWMQNIEELGYLLNGVRESLEDNLISLSALERIGIECFKKHNLQDIKPDGIRKYINAKSESISDKNVKILDVAIVNLKGKTVI